MRPVIDHTGRKYGSVTVLAHDSQKSGISFWRVRCDCGKESIKRACNLATLQGCSRGCPVTCKRIMGNPAYATWYGMKTRCENPNATNWSRYGGRGITVCERWRESFTAFWEDMGPTYREGLQLDRRDNDGPYCKENCHWVTSKENNLNRCNNIVSRDQRRVADTNGISPKVLSARLRNGWPVEKAIAVPINHSNKCPSS